MSGLDLGRVENEIVSSRVYQDTGVVLTPSKEFGTQTGILLLLVIIITHSSINILSVPHYPLPSDRQHPSYGDCLAVKREYYQNCSVLDCVTQCSQ